MSARSKLVRLAAKAGMLFGAIFVVTILLAAVPGHHAPAQTPAGQQASADAGAEQDSAQSSTSSKPASSTDMSDEKASEKAAVEDMTPGHEDPHSLHMHMTAMRPEAPGDAQRAHEIVTQLRAGIEKYRDYHAALNDGFHIFAPNIPQPEYHFTSYRNGFLESLTFDPARPTSLLYKKTATGYELVGAMYTMPRNATEDQLNERIPLSIAMWHQHTNLCFPKLGHLRDADWTKFGLKGSIATQEACDAAGGRFHPVVFGWMTHVYPYEDATDKIFAMHMD
jgi:hypothetical protein